MTDNKQESKLHMVNETIGDHNTITLQEAIRQGIVVPLPTPPIPIIKEPKPKNNKKCCNRSCDTYCAKCEEVCCTGVFITTCPIWCPIASVLNCVLAFVKMF